MTAQTKLTAEKAAAAARAILAGKPVIQHVTKLLVPEPVNIAIVIEPVAAAAVAEVAPQGEAVPEKLMASAIAVGKAKKRDRGGHLEKKSKKLKRTVYFEGFGDTELAALEDEVVVESLANVMKVDFG